MHIVMFYHSFLSDWNHGNAHFLRGIVGELQARGHSVSVHEPANGWSMQNLVAEHGEQPLHEFAQAYPGLASTRYDPTSLDLDQTLDGADLVLVHEWNDHALVARIGQHRARQPGYRLLFHDTHHRAATAPESMAAYDLRHYDGVLVFGKIIGEIYRVNGWAQHVWTWHEAADTRVFRPLTPQPPLPHEGEGELVSPLSRTGRGAGGEGKDGDLVWIGNWGDEERSAELREFLLGPVQALGLRARVHGVRYPEHARAELAAAGVAYAGWLPNYRAPEVFARFRATVHVMRRPYVERLPGIPTIRVFEALACGIPLACSPWDDAEGLFTPGRDFLVARDGAEMQRHLDLLVHDEDAAQELAAHGLATIRARHTCAHRVDELLEIYDELSDCHKGTKAQT